MKEIGAPLSSKEIVENLGIGDSTLRKWCLSLEERNYTFVRTDQNKRMFTDKDLFVLSQFKILVQDKNLSINNAAAVIASKYSNDAVFSDETEKEQLPAVQTESPFVSETLQELKAEMEQLKDINRMLLAKLDEQHKYIENRLEYIENRQEERDKLLMQSLRESQETKQLLLEAKEEKKQRKGIFKFFSKD